MTPLPRHKSSSVSTTMVLPFPGPRAAVPTHTSSSIVRDLTPSLDALSDTLKAAVEMVIAEAYIKQGLHLVSSDNPFDPVYISRLTPDPISPYDLGAIYQFAKITDQSESISFNDGWDG